jgi:group I intron endonuclease
MISGIYQILNLANGKRYIGSAQSLAARWEVHKLALYQGGHHSSKLQRTWNKYGETSFVFKPLLICAPKDLLMYEQRCLDSYKPEYNICRTAGSSLGVKRSAETRAKIGATKVGNEYRLGSKSTEATRAKISVALAGNKNCLGRKLTKGTRAKIGATKIGNKYCLGRECTAETRANISAAKRTAHQLRREQCLS